MQQISVGIQMKLSHLMAQSLCITLCKLIEPYMHTIPKSTILLKTQCVQLALNNFDVILYIAL